MSVPKTQEENGIASESYAFSVNGTSSGDSTSNSGTNHVPPEMMFKISKKIAQLTKVIYSLNTRNEDLERELTAVKAVQEEKSIISEGQVANGTSLIGAKKSRSKTPETGDTETKKELRRAKHIMRQLEAKMKAMEDERERVKSTESAPSPQSKPIVDKQVKQLSKEKTDLSKKVDRLEIQNEQLRLEREQIKKDYTALNKEKSAIQLELSANRVQISYNQATGTAEGSRAKSVPNAPGQTNDTLVDELRSQVERLTQEKITLSRELQESRMWQQTQKKQLEQAKKDVEQAQRFHQQTMGSRSSQDQDALLKVRREKVTLQTALDEVKNKHERDVRTLQDDRGKLGLELEQVKRGHTQELEQARVVGQALEGEVKRRKTELDRCQKEHAEALTSWAERCSHLDKELSEKKEEEKRLQAEMGQSSEAVVQAEDRCKSVEKERDEYKRKCHEIQIKMDLLNKTGRSRGMEGDDKLKGLEKALEEALAERHEILEAASAEIDQQKTIAMETEQKMMDDFEWKLREIEGEYRQKMKDMDKSVESRVHLAQADFERKKDAEFVRLSINLRREMEEQMRDERSSQRSALDNKSHSDLDEALRKCRYDKDRELRSLQRAWEEERNTLNREKRSLMRKVEDLPKTIAEATKELRAQSDTNIHEERRRHSKTLEKAQEDYDKLRDELNGQMARLRVDYDEKIEELQGRVDNANTNRYSSMFQMKEEVESEFCDRMEQLRCMYKGEIENLTEKLEEEKSRAKIQEEALEVKIHRQHEEIEELNTYYNQNETEYETKVTDLLTRLQEQTTLAQKLQTELDEYEWYEEDEEGNITERPPSSKGHAMGRPSSAKPLDQHRIKSRSSQALGQNDPTATTALASSGLAASSMVPHIPPRHNNKVGEEESRAKEGDTSSYTTVDRHGHVLHPRDQPHFARTETSRPSSAASAHLHRLRHSSTLPNRASSAGGEIEDGAEAGLGRGGGHAREERKGKTLSRMFANSPKLTKKRSTHSASSSQSGGSKKNNCTHQ